MHSQANRHNLSLGWFVPNPKNSKPAYVQTKIKILTCDYAFRSLYVNNHH